MYQVKEIGIGKKVCNADGITHLYHSLSQRKLKRLLQLNCEFIEYAEREPKREETTQCEEVPAKESAKDNSTSTTRRKQRSGKRAKKS